MIHNLTIEKEQNLAEIGQFWLRTVSGFSRLVRIGYHSDVMK